MSGVFVVSVAATVEVVVEAGVLVVSVVVTAGVVVGVVPVATTVETGVLVVSGAVVTVGLVVFVVSIGVTVVAGGSAGVTTGLNVESGVVCATRNTEGVTDNVKNKISVFKCCPKYLFVISLIDTYYSSTRQNFIFNVYMPAAYIKPGTMR